MQPDDLIIRKATKKDNLEKISESLRLYVNEEDEINANFNRCYRNILENYESDNTSFLTQLDVEKNMNLKKVKESHESNIFLINKRIETVNIKIANTKKIDESMRNDRIV